MHARPLRLALHAPTGEARTDGARSRRWFGWWMLGAALLLHLPLALSSGLGRDEAAYVVWAFHPEPAYSPLLQLLIRACVPTPGFGTHQPRVAAWLLCVAVAWLAARRARGGGASMDAAWMAAVALATSPWQAYVGPLLHPDNALLGALLLLAMAARAGHPLRIAGAALLAVAAKPTGLLVVPAACLALQYCDSRVRRRVRLAQLLIVAGALASAALLRPATVRAMAQFAKLAAETPLSAKLAAGALPLLLGAGPLLLAGAVAGARARWRLVRQGATAPASAHREALLVLLAAATFAGSFAAAALWNGQVKGSWLLPPVALLWPATSVPSSARWSCGAAIAAVAMSAVLAAAFLAPSWLARLEARGVPPSLAYPGHAGQREAYVSSARRWSDRLREYHSVRPFAAAVEREFRSCAPSAAMSDSCAGVLARNAAIEPHESRPSWLVSDDYGLAAQLLCAWGDPRPRVILPEDGIFDRTLPPHEALEHVPPTLLLAVRRPADALWPRLGPVVHCGPVPHPVTGLEVAVARAGAARIPQLD